VSLFGLLKAAADLWRAPAALIEASLEVFHQSRFPERFYKFGDGE
jgi:hypothetical protein